MQQSTYFDLDSIGNRDDGRRRRRKRNNQPGRRWTRKMEDTTITWKHKRASAVSSRRRVMLFRNSVD
jgi:hypothetical protein